MGLTFAHVPPFGPPRSRQYPIGMPAYTTVAHTAIWLVQRLRGVSHGSSTERIGPHVAQRGAAMAAAVVGTSVIDDPKDVSGSTDKEIEYVTHSKTRSSST